MRDVGEMESLPYRLLLGGGGYVWLTTVAWGENSGQNIHCIHTVVSQVFHEGEILSTIQGQIGKKMDPNKGKPVPDMIDDILVTTLEGNDDIEESQMDEDMDLFSLIEEGLNDTDSSQESSFNREKEIMLSDDDNFFIGQDDPDRSFFFKSNSSYNVDPENNRIFSPVFSDPLLSSQPSVIRKSKLENQNRKSPKKILRQLLVTNIPKATLKRRNYLDTLLTDNVTNDTVEEDLTSCKDDKYAVTEYGINSEHGTSKTRKGDSVLKYLLLNPVVGKMKI